MTPLSLDQAAAIVDGALEHAAAQKMHAMTVAVLDAGGHLVAFKRQDRSGILRPDIAYGKAWGALGMGVGSRGLGERVKIAPAFYTALASVSAGRMIPVAGGVLIRDAEGEIIGAVGVSGDVPDNDEACAVHAITKCGLTPDPGQGH